MANANRNRLINAIVFFAKNTQYCGKTKLFKLLYLLDFEHFRQTGKSVTGFEYHAWKYGPVPVELMEAWEVFGEEVNGDLAEAVHIKEEKVYNYDRKMIKVNDGVQFDADQFTPRQIKLMEELANRYNDTYSPSMIDVTHQQNGAWYKVWSEGRGAYKIIPYDLAIPDTAPEKGVILQIAAEQAMYQAALKAARAASPE